MKLRKLILLIVFYGIIRLVIRQNIVRKETLLVLEEELNQELLKKRLEKM